MNASTVPAEGEPGSTTANPCSPMAETLPDNPATIVQSTSINTLMQILTANWIYQSTFTVSTTQAPGTIVYYKKVHPKGWNWANSHVAQMFNCWTGSGSVRYRPVATVWYGGSVRVGFLPPSIAEEDISKIPLEVLTTFPNRDIDPKNTGWVCFAPPDERNIAYHYMDDTGRQSFGGWVVFYIAARLVTQSPEFNTISMLLETKGGFMFDQPNPNVLSRVAVTSHPLATSTVYPLSRQLITESGIAPNVIAIQPMTTTRLAYPGHGHSSFGYAESTLPDSPDIKNVLKTNVNYQFNLGETLSFVSDTTPYGFVYTKAENSGTLTLDPPKNVTLDGNKVSIIYAGSEFPVERAFKLQRIQNSVDTQSLTINTENALTTVRKVQGLNIPQIIRERSSESVVVFANTDCAMYASQTQLHQQDIANFEEQTANSRVTYLYQLITDSGTPLMYLRLWPTGLFTTNGSASIANVPITKGMRIRYLNTLLADDPIPPVSTTYYAIKPMLQQLARKNISVNEVLEELAML